MAGEVRRVERHVPGARLHVAAARLEAACDARAVLVAQLWHCALFVLLKIRQVVPTDSSCPLLNPSGGMTAGTGQGTAEPPISFSSATSSRTGHLEQCVQPGLLHLTNATRFCRRSLWSLYSFSSSPWI